MKRPGPARRSRTPIRSALRESSSLHERVRDGLGGVKTEHRDYLEDALRPEFGDSLDLDEALREGHEQAHRWDYLLGHSPTAVVVAVEPHHAKQDQVTRIIAKREAARSRLRIHLKPGAAVGAWLWVASGRVHFADTESVRRRLDENGILFVGTKVLRKHLPTEGSKLRARRRG